MYEAGVVATDIRLPNIFYKCVYSSSSSTADASTSHEICGVKLKLIDIDEFYICNDFLPSWLVENMTNDARYPQSRNRAEAIFHVHYLDQIRRKLFNKRTAQENEG